jgi:hypothetical protein
MTKIRTILYIEAFNKEMKINLITKLLPIKPYSVRQMGDPIIMNNKNTGRVNMNSSWKYEILQQNVRDIKPGLNEMINLLKPYKESIKDIKYKYGFHTSICVVITIKDFLTPAMTVDTYIISELFEMGIELSFDLYFE